MSYHERRSVVNIVSTILITVIYSAYMLQSYPEGDAYAKEIFRFWGEFLLILIPVSIVAKIFIHIGFSIFNTIATNEGEPDIVDERDKLIELKATRNSLYVFTFGFLLAMGALVMDRPPATMFTILIFAGVLSDLMSEVSQLYFYRSGV